MNKLLTIYFFSFVLALLMFSGCNNSTENVTKPVETRDYTKVPDGFPPMPVPADNPITPEKAELGRMLFYETMLSKDNTFSCNLCHQSGVAFTNSGIAIARTPEGAVISRNVLPLFNVGYYNCYFWDGGGPNLETILYADLTIPEIFMNDTNVIQKRLEASPKYPQLFRKAFGDSAKPQGYLIARALATFVRTIVSGNSRYDKYIRGDKTALTAEEKKGMDLFFSDRLSCSKCHSGILFTDMKFHNTGSTTHYFDRGRYYVTGNLEDKAKFRTPTLRNVALTAPYLHEGNYNTLEDVINNYDRGGLEFINKDKIIKPLNLTKEEKSSLIDFLKALTDEEFIKSQYYINPNR